MVIDNYNMFAFWCKNSVCPNNSPLKAVKISVLVGLLHSCHKSDHPHSLQILRDSIGLYIGLCVIGIKCNKV